jgi:hypothetical protein
MELVVVPAKVYDYFNKDEMLVLEYDSTLSFK